MTADASVQRTRVLVIDDSPLDRELFRLLLAQVPFRPFELLEEEQGRSSLKRILESTPDCALLDLNLPDIDGLDLLKQILELPYRCPVIVTTAHGSEQIAVQAMKMGAADYLVKGFATPEALKHTIENAMEKHALVLQIESQRAAIEASEERYRTLARAVPQIVWTAKHPTGDFDYVNEQWTRVTGAPAASAYGTGWLDFVSEQDRAQVRAAWASSRSNAATFEIECRLRAANGKERWQLLRCVPLIEELAHNRLDGSRTRVPSGIGAAPDGLRDLEKRSAARWIGTFTDIEERKRAEQLLGQKQKLESIGLLAGGIAHDFNNLLVGIVGGVSYALEVLPPNHELQPMLESSLRAGERAAHLTRQMLAYAGKGRFLVERFDLSELVQSTAALIKGSIPQSVDLKLLTRHGLPQVETDSSQLQQVIMNLIINAAESIPPDTPGWILVRTDVERLESPLPLLSTVLKPGEYVVLEVTDSGCGMDAETQSRIFDPFFTTKFTGRGLGLAAVQGILNGNRGGIDVKSALGKGSRFRVLIPAASPAEGTTALAKDSARTGDTEEAKPVAGKARILIVDDEEMVRKTARVSLERVGHAVVEAKDGAEAIEMVRQSPNEFSLVVLDLSMPGLSGQQTLEQLRKLNGKIPILLCSGFSATEMERQFEGRGANGLLEKPFTSSILREKIDRTLIAARELNPVRLNPGCAE